MNLSRLVHSIVAALACLPLAASADPFINEFNARNCGILLDSGGVTSGTNDVDGNSSDWMELRNPDAVTVNLNGWALSDDPLLPGKWIIPSVNLAANGYLLIFASGKDRAVSGVQLHTNFTLAKSGSLILSRPNGGGGWITVHQVGNYPDQNIRFSYGCVGVPGSGGTLGYFEKQTPGAANSATQVTAFVADTSFSVKRGFYDTARSVTITTPTVGATLIYTLNGSEPTTVNGAQVPPPDAATAPSVTLNITTTTCVRARAIKAGLGATNVDTHTYLFPAAVLAQNSPPSTSLTWGSSGPDWQMDPDVVNHADPESKCVTSDLKSIPAISVVMNWNDLFGGSTAIYPPASGVGIEGVERRISVEMINPNGDKIDPNTASGFQEDAFIEIFGGSSPSRWRSDKLSFKVGFCKNLKFNLYGDDATDSFNNMVLDARFNNTWHYGGTTDPEGQHLRSDYYGDSFTGDVQRTMGGPGEHARPVHVYLNGMYWGMYIMHERPDEHFAAAYLGGNDDEWDVVKHSLTYPTFLVAGRTMNPAQPVSNTNHTAGVNYQALVNLAGANLSIAANYNAVAAKVDLENFIEYMLLNFYVGNNDWSHQNWYASYHRTDPNAKWRWHAWDAEHVMESVTADETTDDGGGVSSGGPGYIHQRLVANAEYRLLFADIAHRHLFNNGVLTNPQVWQLFDQKMQIFSEALRAESARWGDNRAAARPSPFTNVPYLRGVEWFNQRNFWQNTYFPARSNNAGSVATGSVLAQLKARTLYPNLAAPTFSQHGGAVPADYNLTMTNPGGAGTIQFTTDGTDPRNPATNSPSATASAYSGAVTLPASVTVKARVLNGTTWSALNEASFSVGTVPAAAGNLVISKIHYRPGAPTAAEIAAGFNDRNVFEFIEVLNVSANRVDLSGISFSAGLDISLTPGGVVELAPGGRALLVANKAAFELRYGTGLPIAGEFILGSNLDNGGEQLTLLAANGSVIVSFAYDDDPPWATNPDGSAPSLVLMNPGVRDPSDGSNWRASTVANGAPAIDDRLYFAAWQAAQFPGGGPDAAADADPDHDGLSNLLEFGLGTDAHTFTSAAVLPSVSIELFNIGSGPEPFAYFTFRHVKAAEELTFSAQTSIDFSSWASDATVLVPVGLPVDNSDGTETRMFRSPQHLDAESSRFFRVMVQMP